MTTDTYPLRSVGTCSHCGADETSSNDGGVTLYCHRCFRNSDGFAVDADGLDFFDHRYGHLGAGVVQAERDKTLAASAALAEANKCTPGQECQDILRLCSKHSWEYQRQFGRAANE